MNIKKLSKDIEILEPVFKENNCAVCFSSSDYYVPYLTTLLASLKATASAKNNYDIIVFNKDITPENQQIIKKYIEAKNISVRFYSVSKIFKDASVYVPVHIESVTIETYFRLLTPYILQKYPKALFLDSDMMILSDVKELYDTDIKGYALASTHESLFLPSYREGVRLQQGKDCDYFEIGRQQTLAHLKTLGVLEIEKYFQAGMILFNCQYFKQNKLVEKVFENIQKKDYIVVDQDALNELCYGKVLLLDGQWNYAPATIGNFVELMDPDKRQAYLATVPKIIHFIGRDWKPWVGEKGEYHYQWWQYARQTPYYETILSRLHQLEFKKFQTDFMTQLQATQISKIKEALKTYNEYRRCQQNYNKYTFRYKFVFGKTKKRYAQKMKMYKELLDKLDAGNNL